jgi:hypothetical protein
MAKGKKKKQEEPDKQVADAAEAQSAPPAPSGEAWRALWMSLDEGQRALLTQEAQSAPASHEETRAPAAAAAQPPVVNCEREAERLWVALKDSERVKCVQLEGVDTSTVFRRDRALVLLIYEIEQRASNEMVRCLVWGRVLQTAPAFKMEAEAVGLSSLNPEASTRYAKLKDILVVKQRCVSVVNQAVARTQTPQQAGGETIAAYLQRLRLEQEALSALLALLPSEHASKVVVPSPGGAALFRGLTPVARATAEADRARIFEAAATAADHKANSTGAGDRLRAAATMVMQTAYTAENAFALLGFNDAVLALERVSVTPTSRNTPVATAAVAADAGSGGAAESVAAMTTAPARSYWRPRPRDLSQVRCFTCSELGHVAAKCPKDKTEVPAQPTPPSPAMGRPAPKAAASKPAPKTPTPTHVAASTVPNSSSGN